MERQEIQQLFMQHYAKMLRVARTILYDEQESEDVVSDIFEHLLHKQTVLISDSEERYLLLLELAATQSLQITTMLKTIG